MKALLLFLFTMNAMAQTCEGISRSPAVVEEIAENFREISSKVAHANYDLFSAIDECNPKRIKKALKHGADVNATNDGYTGQTKRYTALTYSVKLDCIEATQILLENHARVDDERSIDNNTALMIATRRNRVKFAQLLLSYNANVNAGSTFERSALNIAGWNNSIEIAQLLLTKREIDLNVNPTLGRNALGSALMMGNNEIVEMILNHSSDITPMTAETISSAAKWAKTEEMKVRLQKYLEDHGQK